MLKVAQCKKKFPKEESGVKTVVEDRGFNSITFQKYLQILY